MSKPDTLLRTGFALFSAITSFLLVYYAVSVINGGSTSEWLKSFAYVAGGYGLLNIYILSWAWRSRNSWTSSANLVIAVCFFGVVVMDLLRNGMHDGIQIVGILGLAAVLGVNWFTIKVLCQPVKS
jgi:hypothetical protein